MRILYCNKYNYRFSGTEAYLFEAMRLMRLRGHQTALFSVMDARGEATAYDRYFVRPMKIREAGGLLSKLRAGLRAIYSLEARKKIARVIEEFRPDVAHVRNIYHHLSPSILWELKSRGVPVLYHLNDFKLICPSYNLVSAGQACERCRGGKFWNVVPEGCYSGGRAAGAVLAAEAYFHKWTATYEKCLDLIVTPSDFAKLKLVENGWDATRIHVLPHFQTLPVVAPPPPSPGQPILCFGRLSAEKGVQDVIAAMATMPDVQLLIAGDGPERSRLESLAQLISPKNVRFVGQVSAGSLEQLIAASQFTIFPSRAYETMGKSILESYAQGRAVIASDLGSRRELVHDGETGRLYPVGDVHALSSAIRWLRGRPELAIKMGEAGRELLRRRHCHESHVRALEEIYGSLASESSQRKPFVGNNGRQAGALRIAFIGGRGVIRKYSGVETYYEELGSRLAIMGHEVSAYCRSYFTPKVPGYLGVRVVRLPTLRTKHLETFVHTLLSTGHACFSDYDIVHYHTLGPSMFAWVPRLFGKKTLVTVQGLDWQRKKWGAIARFVLKLCERTSVRGPDKTVVVSRTLQEHYRSRYDELCEFVPNGTRLRARQRAGSHLSRCGLKPDGYVLFLGRFSPEKNCHVLISAFEALTTDSRLVLAGGSSHTDEYAARLRQHESKQIIFLDWLSGEALDEVLTNAAVFVLPSDMEGMSLALLDAMGAGVCVLASDVAENLEVIGDAGFTFRHGDVHDLQRMLARLLSNPGLREGAAMRAQQRVREHYLWEKVADEMDKVYRSLLPERFTSELKARAEAA